MAKNKPIEHPAPSFWLPFVTVGVVGMLLGSTITYLALRPKLQQLREAASGPVSQQERTAHFPPPELTAGLLPAQADHVRANFHYDRQNWEEAIRLYKSAISQGVNSADIHTDLGNVYRFVGRTDEALAQYTHAQQLEPNHEFSLFNQGGLYLEDLGQPAKAIEIWNQYLVRFPAGRNVVAARQLIARARSGSSGATLPAAAMPEPTSATEDLILRQIKSGQPGKTAPAPQ